MSQEVSDKKTYEVRSSNMQGLEMPRADEWKVAARGQLPTHCKIRLERGATAGASMRKGRERGHRHRYYQSLVHDTRGEPGFGDRLELKASAPGPYPPRSSKATIVISDPEPVDFMKTG